MKTTIVKATIALTAILFAGQASAGFMIEPFLGYQSGDFTGGGGAKEDISGTEFGLRLGGTTAIISYGVEYAKGSLEVDATPTVDVDTTDMGVFIGIDFPVLIRAYATYFVKSEAEMGNIDFEGNGMRLGVGYTGLPFLSINLEKINRTYDEAAGMTMPTKMKSDTYMLSVSLPLP